MDYIIDKKISCVWYKSLGSSLMGQFDSDGPQWLGEQSRCWSNKLARSANCTLVVVEKERIGGVWMWMLVKWWFSSLGVSCCCKYVFQNCMTPSEKLLFFKLMNVRRRKESPTCQLNKMKQHVLKYKYPVYQYIQLAQSFWEIVQKI